MVSLSPIMASYISSSFDEVVIGEGLTLPFFVFWGENERRQWSGMPANTHAGHRSERGQESTLYQGMSVFGDWMATLTGNLVCKAHRKHENDQSKKNVMESNKRPKAFSKIPMTSFKPSE